MQSNQTQEIKHVLSHDLADFLTQFQEAVEDGYKLDLQTNEHYPFFTLSQYIVTLVKKSTKAKATEQVVTTEVTQVSDEPVKKVGRKAKAE